MRTIPLSNAQPFRLVFSAINSFLHLADRSDQLRSLRSIREVLDRDGLLVLDLLHPTPDTLKRMDDRYTFDASWQLSADRRVERFSYRQLDVAEQTIMTTLFYDLVDVEGNIKRTTTSYSTRYIHRFEMESLL